MQSKDKSLVTEFQAILKEKNAVQFDGLDPQGYVHLVVSADQAPKVLAMLTLAGQTFKVKIFKD